MNYLFRDIPPNFKNECKGKLDKHFVSLLIQNLLKKYMGLYVCGGDPSVSANTRKIYGEKGLFR